MRILPTVLVAAAFLIAGCVGSAPPTEVEPTDEPNAGLPDFKPVPVEVEEPRTILDAPKWKQGEWWKIRMVDEGFTGTVYEATRVVVGQEGDNYLVGMPTETFSHAFMVIHIPGFGQVAKDDLSFEIHDVPFQPLRFPLIDGDSWVTAFEGRAVTMTVHVESQTRARIEMASNTGQPGDYANLTYDAEIGEIVKNDQPNYASYEVVEHGYNFTGVVTVPHMHDVVFQHFRIGAPIVSLNPLVSPSYIDTIEVDSTYDHVSFGLLFFAAGAAAGAPAPAAGGYYQETATSPSGKEYTMTVMPNDGPVAIMTLGEDNPGGTWTFEHIVAGAGLIGAEGIAYHTYDVEMPSGHIMQSTGEHKHGS